jgi:hypothetical protein
MSLDTFAHRGASRDLCESRKIGASLSERTVCNVSIKSRKFTVFKPVSRDGLPSTDVLFPDGFQGLDDYSGRPLWVPPGTGNPMSRRVAMRHGAG